MFDVKSAATNIYFESQFLQVFLVNVASKVTQTHKLKHPYKRLGGITALFKAKKQTNSLFVFLMWLSWPQYL